MSTINWKMAPSGAEAYQPEGPEQFPGWYKKIKGEVYWWQLTDSQNEQWLWMGGRRDFPVGAIIRPAVIIGQPAWVGVGIPPVGTVCEVLPAKQVPYIAEITAIGRLSLLVWVAENDCEIALSTVTTQFRPIDAKAKAREQAAKELFEVIAPDGKWHELIAEHRERYYRAVDAGWIKPGESK